MSVTLEDQVFQQLEEVDPALVEEVVDKVFGLPLAYDTIPDWLLSLVERVARAIPKEDECVD